MRLTGIFLLTLSVFLPTICPAEFTVNPMFSDGMVIQRNAKVSIWGTADPGDKVKVSFGEENPVVTTGDDGTWTASFLSKEASTQAATMSIKSEGKEIVLSGILVGDVWLCSGQSNMAFKLSRCIDGKADAEGAMDPLIRVNNYQSSWGPCLGGTAAETSGVAYYFAQKRRELNPEVPVGLIVRALSGSPIQAWTPVEALNEVPVAQEMMTRFRADGQEGKNWIAYSKAADERKRRRRKGELPGKMPAFDGDNSTKVVAEIYYTGNPGKLWRERVEPLAGYTLAGVIWYQGERNSKGGETEAGIYHDLLMTLIKSWRSAWGQGDFRFLAVQLPPYAKGGPNWEIVRQGQAAAVQEVPNADFADLSDLPDEGDLHPANKRPVGERLADLAVTAF
ncbi:MAG: sialate O-acetylesterase [Verrucomicrobiales bacterium]|nr:sialate O-acetylesterase [Verrucomicrobiales bacterium]